MMMESILTAQDCLLLPWESAQQSAAHIPARDKMSVPYTLQEGEAFHLNSVGQEKQIHHVECLGKPHPPLKCFRNNVQQMVIVPSPTLLLITEEGKDKTFILFP